MCANRYLEKVVEAPGGIGAEVVEEEILELKRSEQTITVESVLRKSVMAGFGIPRRARSLAERASKSVLWTRLVEEVWETEAGVLSKCG